MKKMQCKALNIKVVTKQLWFYFICGTTQLGYAGTITNLQIVLETQKNPYLNQATCTKKNTCLPKEILQSSLSLEIQSTPPPPPTLGIIA